MKLIVATAILAATALAAPAFAQGGGLLDPVTYLHGGYVEIEGGSTVQGATSEFDSGVATGSGTTEGSGHFRDGYFGGALLGHKIAPGLAVEAEGVYFYNNYNGVTVRETGVSGSSRTYGGFGNVRFSLPYDYRFSSFAIVPYVAGGIGYGDVRYQTNFLDDDQSRFMWQGKAGLEIKTGLPVSFDLGYRYIETPEYHKSFQDGGTFSFSQRSHVQAATFGVKYTF